MDANISKNIHRKVLFIGLDAVPSNLIFNDLSGRLHNIERLMKKGVYGTLRSCHPPITVPAWTVMMSSKDPGSLGIYGFRHRQGFSYDRPWVVSSSTVKHRRIWEILAEHGKKSIVIGVPPAYPPYGVNGKLVSCFLTPPNAKNYTFPPEAKDEVEKISPGYSFDVPFRTENRDEILDNIYKMTEKRFDLIKNWIKEDQWDYFMFMEIGTDRLHHAFWKFYDKSHPKFLPNNKYENVIPEYYQYIDKKIGELLDLIDNDTVVIVASDHGTKSMHGAFCINEWLIKEGYLVLKEYPKNVVDIEKSQIDWEKTSVWGWGGYYARIFLNVKGREKNGVILKKDYETFLEELKRKLEQIPSPQGRKMKTIVSKPEEIYENVVGDSPDLMVYFDDLFWRSAGTIGHNTLYLSENDTGPDDSVHSMDGMFILYDKQSNSDHKIDNLSIYDVAPTVLKIFGIDSTNDMQGKVIQLQYNQEIQDRS